jgi:dTDP-4-dehydrorhamnose reductase
VSAVIRRSLLIGASGQLGLALAGAFRGDALVRASNRHVGEGHVRLDLGDPSSTLQALRDTRPDLVLVAGAMCNVDLCEQQPDECRRANTDGPALVAEYARTHGARVVLYSTDHVFDGTSPSYVETDVVNPLNEYARSKARAEEAVRDLLPDRHLILRTSWVYGPDAQRRNFVLRLVDRLRAGETVPVPVDQWGSPTYTDDLAAATRFLVDRDDTGTFHATGPDLFTRGALAALICRRFDVESQGVLNRSTSELRQSAPRPLRVQLDCTKLHATRAPAFRSVEQGLQSLVSAVAIS